MSVVIKCGLSPLDWRSHAVDERADHPIGVYRAQCGHLLMMITALPEMPGSIRPSWDMTMCARPD